MPISTIAAGTARRADLNTNFAACLTKDTAQTVTVSHTFSAGMTVGDTITSTASGLILSRNVASTAIQYCQILNTTGGFAWGIEGSAGGALIAGAAAYDAVIRSKQGGICWSTDDGATKHARLASGTLTLSGQIVTATSTPASAAATGVAGTIAWDSSFIYVCTATNTWKRAAIATW